MGILAPIWAQSITYLYLKSCFEDLFETSHVLRHYKYTELLYNYLLKFCYFYMPDSPLLFQFPPKKVHRNSLQDCFKIVYGNVVSEVHKIGFMKISKKSLFGPNGSFLLHFQFQLKHSCVLRLF